MAMARKPEVQGEDGQIGGSVSYLIKRIAQAEPAEVRVQGPPGFSPENVGQMKWGAEDGTSDVMECNFVAKIASQE